jgi:hypothetical protein
LSTPVSAIGAAQLFGLERGGRDGGEVSSAAKSGSHGFCGCCSKEEPTRVVDDFVNPEAVQRKAIRSALEKVVK